MNFVDPEKCSQGPHRGPQGPNEDIGQCPECLSMSYAMRPSNEQIGLHIDDCSLDLRHPSFCVGGGEGHAPVEIVRGYWPGMDADVAAARERFES